MGRAVLLEYDVVEIISNKVIAISNKEQGM